MDNLRRKLIVVMEAKGFSQVELPRKINFYHSIIENRNETKQKPTFDIVKKLADVLEATEEATEEYKTLKSPSIMKSLN